MSLTAPAFTVIDALSQAVAAGCYLAVGVGAWLRARTDIRTRVFLAFSLANVVVFGVPTGLWIQGAADPAKMPAAATAVVMAGLGVGALLLFHFTQVLPRRRPWIRTSGVQMAVAYALAPLAIAGLVWFAPASMAGLRPGYVLAIIVFGFPLMVLLGFVLPVAAIVSLSRSHREACASGALHIKRVLELVLISQVGGGVLAVVFAPVLAAVAPDSASRLLLTAAIWALNILTPLAFAAAVWKYDVLAVSPD